MLASQRGTDSKQGCSRCAPVCAGMHDAVLALSWLLLLSQGLNNLMVGKFFHSPCCSCWFFPANSDHTNPPTCYLNEEDPKTCPCAQHSLSLLCHPPTGWSVGVIVA